MAVDKKALKIVKEVKNLCSDLFKDKLHAVYLYGSYARGDFDKYSDIDILISVDITEKQLLKYQRQILKLNCNLTWKYDIIVSIVIVPLGRFVQYSKYLPFYRNVIKEGINYGTN